MVSHYRVKKYSSPTMFFKKKHVDLLSSGLTLRKSRKSLCVYSIHRDIKYAHKKKNSSCLDYLSGCLN